MKTLFLVTILLIASLSYAQERQAGAGVIYVNSPGTGNAPGKGVRADIVLPIQDLFTLVAETNWVVEPKIYIGDGSGNALRVRAEGRVHVWPRQANISPFVSAGVSGVRQWTSQYSKGATTWTHGAGLVLHQRFVPYWKHFWVEKKTPNKVGGDEFGGEVYLPLNETRWRIRAGVAGVNTRFTQIGGPFAGKHSSWALQAHFGVGWVF